MLDVRSEQVRDETKERRWFAFLLVNGGWWDRSLLHTHGGSAGDFTVCAEAATKAPSRRSATQHSR